MNAAARSFNSVSVFEGDLTGIRLTQLSFKVVMIMLLVILSALSLVYLKNLQRDTVSQIQAESRSAHQLKIERSQLLLEQSTWAAPGRVANMASSRLQLRVPSAEQIQYLAH